MKDRSNQRGQFMVDYTVMMALFLVIFMLVGYYWKGAMGNKAKEVADQISEGQFDPKRATFNVATNSSSSRTEDVQATGITTTTITSETTNRSLDQATAKPTASDKLFDAKW